ncbi:MULTISPECIES: DegT/DnrJ/EryC1/StrS family aminotransferase [Streptomyces]|uniref:DegT/DnrJ/EryC1/StrS aminotransferase n=2 Tax=Streptomyces rimosus subsp. rimosus TaxID=132474 RepID=L8EDF0_STRR1|nr:MULTISPECIES: DegT/DnrJ/EryC1/StrS family aminotransferase [Streptomyces]KOG68271.1 DegT/DnrJ/EryC1/StrS aminotransferase [Kitasatospora aureofaciens]MYT43056.1 DegT/DnrJ/EryC1/StrS aminotransferase [Streptomyces sp. SID5471]KEF02438.1 DegT/DnrJ/EryC1/StrS aminotransferase [Streptomyces rimosus]KEF18113.1 DegT/DnrJ/EryC1/StrS aminotransferase [Streptomyces rimosus]KOT27149.1 DegT/DnrJ/EryC1/StrS aminotransferase [Streptomyces sp. NRRL WC-3701]
MGTVGTLRSAGVREGDEVVVPAYGNPEVAEAVVELGALPVYADVDADSYCLDPAAVADAVTPRTAAVVAVHRFGRPADMGWIRKTGQRHGLLVVAEDEPGAGHTDRDEVRRRRERAAYLDGRLTGVATPPAVAGHTYEQYVVRVPGNGRPDRDAFARALRSRGVACRVPVQTPVYRLPRLRRDVYLPQTERAVDETLALPVRTALSRRELQRLATACNALGGLLQPAF